jgi:hypothetical protein
MKLTLWEELVFRGLGVHAQGHGYHQNGCTRVALC